MSEELDNDAIYNSRCKLAFFTSVRGHKHIIYMPFFPQPYFLLFKKKEDTAITITKVSRHIKSK